MTTPVAMTITLARTAAFATLLLTTAPVEAAESAFASAPQRAERSAARLLSAGPVTNGVYHAGLEIALLPETVTYWRQPGEAGSPPVFDFSRSENVARIETLYPTPKHIEEAGSFVAGYDALVVFPLRVTPRDPKAPVRLNLSLDYAACGKICLPAQAKLALDLPQSGASPFAGAIDAAERQTPKKISESDARRLIALTRENKSETKWRLRAAGAERVIDIFPEAPEPLFLDVKPAGGGGFELALEAAAGKAPTPVTATLTIITDKGAYEAPAKLE